MNRNRKNKSGGCNRQCRNCKVKGPFGFSLLLDLYDCNRELCDDMDNCYDFLNKLVIFLKMHKQSEPTVVRTDHEQFPDKRGLSAWVPLVESGIQIHTLTEKRFITIDIYSCRKFSRKNVGDFVKKWYGAGKAEEHFLRRGLKYNKI